MLDSLSYLAIAAASALAAAINSIAGGGTFLTFPALTGLGHLTEKAANMTSTLGLWPGSAASIVAARAEFKSIPRGMAVLYGMLSLAGGAAGALLLTWTQAHTFTLIIPWLLAFATLIFGFSKPIARWAGRRHGERALKWTLLVAGLQLLIALYGGYFGAGIGVLMLAGLSFTGLDSLHQMNALKVLLATLINAMASAVFILRSWNAAPQDAISWSLAGGMVAASIVGGFAGMTLARRVPQNVLRGIILLAGLALTAIYFYRAYVSA